jgi:hypothetical protein
MPGKAPTKCPAKRPPNAGHFVRASKRMLTCSAGGANSLHSATRARNKRMGTAPSSLAEARPLTLVREHGTKKIMVVWINYGFFTIHVRFVGTHKEYDEIDAQTI